MRKFIVKIEKVVSGKLMGQLIAYARSSDNIELAFDVIKDLIKVTPGDVIEITLSESKPENLDEFEFCGHGYLVAPESKFNETIFSIWGIIFKFKPPINLELDKKYYLCIKHLPSS